MLKVNERGIKNKKMDIMKTLGIVVLVGLLAININASGATITSRKTDGYQGAKWGMSPGEVK